MTVTAAPATVPSPPEPDDDALDFDGEPFDPTPAWSDPPPAGAVAASPSPAPTPLTGGAVVSAVLGPLRDRLAAAHASALDAQVALQKRAVAALTARPTTAPTARTATRSFDDAMADALVRAAGTDPAARPVDPEAAFKPLARSARVRLDADDLARLVAGDIAGVFGPAYDQDGANPDVRLAWPQPCVLAEVTRIALRGGPWGCGRVTAAVTGPADPTDAAGAWALRAAEQAAQVFALHVGLHLSQAQAAFVRDGVVPPPDAFGPSPAADGPVAVDPVTGAVVPGDGYDLVADVTGIDLLPRPWVRVEAVLGRGGAPVARVRGVVVAVVERPGAPVGPERGGEVTAFLGRRNARGERALLGEFHLAHFSRGSQAVALGPEFGVFEGRITTRMPNRGLLFVDRVMSRRGQRGRWTRTPGGAEHVTEYDAPADSWYYADTANASMPNVVYMETSLQAAVSLGYHLGATLPLSDQELSVRNLEGHATVLREIDLRDRTIRQRSTLLSTTSMPGSVLQNFGYELTVDGEPFYRGESLFGYFSAEALARQTGLDGGREVPTWLDSQSPRPAVRTIDIAARRATGTPPRASRDHLALLDEVQVVDGGGRHGQGYLYSVRPIDPDDWFFARHFHLDPVIPGSLGVETVIQALQEWLVDSGHADGLRDAEFVVPVGVRFAWRYRGQFLPTDGTVTLEAHIKDIRRAPGRVRVVADASAWKPGLRIYELTDLAVELREPGAPSW